MHFYIANDSWLQLNPSSSQLKSLKKGSSAFEDQQSSYLSSLNVHNFSNSLNPFRQAHGAHGNVSYSRSVPKIVRAMDNMDYKDDLFVKTISSFNACIEPSFDIHKVPSKKEVSNAIFQLTRKQIVVYHTRIVEIGSIIRAFRDSKHSTPGLQGIFVLHQAFISATALCTNPYILSRKQMYAIIESQIPWANRESISRLLLAFDNTNTGYIRYVRLSCALIACLEPAMANLAASLDHTDVKSWNSLASEFNESRNCSFFPYSEAEMKDLKGELVVIRFLHKLYSECNGYLDQSVQSTTAPMMQLQDVAELFSCCTSSSEDDQRIVKLVQPLLQEIYDTVTQRGTLPGTSPIKVGALMKFQELRTEFGLLSISSEVLLECVIKFPEFFREVVRQMRAYRAAAHPYIYNMSMSIEDSVSHFSQSQKSKTNASSSL
ncbi:hypothetical protein EON65_06620 [archaeon]|nr:MAG: hypothetical protein EON65_06620 [archaeon]